MTEFTDATATQVCVKAEDSHVVYGVKVITTNSFYNSQKPELVDYGYSHENIDVVRQHVNVSVEADAATPVADTPEWVYQRNPITLTATVDAHRPGRALRLCEVRVCCGVRSGSGR